MGGKKDFYTECVMKQAHHNLCDDEVLQFDFQKEVLFRPENLQSSGLRAQMRGDFNMGTLGRGSAKDTFGIVARHFGYLDEWQGGIGGLEFKYTVIISRAGDATGSSWFKPQWRARDRRVVMSSLEKIALAFAMEPGIKTLNTVLNKVSRNLFVNLIAYDDWFARANRGKAPRADEETPGFASRIGRICDGFIMDKNIVLPPVELSKIYPVMIR
ncbi:MAG: hypothetical protein LBL21_02065 [Rickettsiales bacterium]|jgi:hypothetical protein|nr:hypothetical protein [Rickettsiales bacterium]